MSLPTSQSPLVHKDSTERLKTACFPSHIPTPTTYQSHQTSSLQPEPPQHPSPSQAQIPRPRPQFTPFFTLVTDTATNTTHHPTNVHYLFSDDDPDLLTSACLSTLSPFSNSAAPPRENRVLLLDLSETGTSITSAHSLSPSWQILHTSFTAAPTWDSSPETEAGGSSGAVPDLMLSIEGWNGSDRVVAGDSLGPESDFQQLMEEFDRHMALLRTVAGDGEAAVKLGGIEGIPELAEEAQDVH